MHNTGKVASIKTIDEVLRMAEGRIKISTYSSSLDNILDGGLSTSELVEVYGESNTGKTQLAMQVSLSASSYGFKSLYIDTEGTFRPERIKEIAERRGLESDRILANIYCTRATDTYSQFECIRSLLSDQRFSNCKMVIVDTLTRNFVLELPGRKNIPRRQSLLAAFLSMLARDAFLNDRAVLLTNRISSIIEEDSSKEVHIGGSTLTQMVDRALSLKREGDKIRVRLVDAIGNTKVTYCSIGSNGIE